MIRTIRMTALEGLCLAALALGGAACTEDFPPYNRLEALRVLAIQSEPVAPAFGETTTLTPLVHTAAGEAVTYAWSWCPFAGGANDGYPCLVSEEQLRAQLGAAGANLPPFDLGTGPTASFTHTLDPAALAPLCAATLPPGLAPFPLSLDCKEGFPVSIKLVVSTPTDTITSVRSLDLRLDPSTPPNTNPRMTNLVALLPVPGFPERRTTAPFDAVGTVVLPRRVETTIQVTVDPTSSEPFVDKNERNEDIPANERLFLTWFVESGSTDDERTSFLPGLTNLLEATINGWRPASVEDYAPATSRIYVVVRDNRGGVSWLSGLATLGAEP